MITTEKQFETDIESFFLTDEGGYIKPSEKYDASVGLYVDTLIGFIKTTQPKEWERFEKSCNSRSIMLQYI